MNKNNYFVLKKTENFKRDCLRLSDVIDICNNESGFKWLEKEPRVITNSDGSRVVDSSNRLNRGLIHKNADPSQVSLILCYEYNDSICIHDDGSDELLEFCRKAAIELECELKII